MKYISALCSDAAFSPYSTLWLGLTNQFLALSQSFLMNNQHPLSLPLSLASLQYEHASELPNTHKSHLKAIFITRCCFLRKCIINQCLWARVLPPPDCWRHRTRSLHLERQRVKPGRRTVQILLMDWREAEASNGSVVRSMISLQFSHSPSGKVLYLQSAPGRVTVVLSQLGQWALGISVFCPCWAHWPAPEFPAAPERALLESWEAVLPLGSW